MNERALAEFHGSRTPAEIIDRLNKEINAGLANPKVTSRLAEFGGIILSGSPDKFKKFVAKTTEKWGKVLRFAGLNRSNRRIFPKLPFGGPCDRAAGHPPDPNTALKEILQFSAVLSGTLRASAAFAAEKKVWGVVE